VCSFVAIVWARVKWREREEEEEERRSFLLNRVFPVVVASAWCPKLGDCGVLDLFLSRINYPRL
jgi:hypothetical protein